MPRWAPPFVVGPAFVLAPFPAPRRTEFPYPAIGAGATTAGAAFGAQRQRRGRLRAVQFALEPRLSSSRFHHLEQRVVDDAGALVARGGGETLPQQGRRRQHRLPLPAFERGDIRLLLIVTAP